jgi:hypothetical protein
MPRVRKPNAEVTEQDKQIAAGAALMLRAIGSRHSSEKLVLAADIADAFADSATPQLKARTRKPKAAVPIGELAGT